MLVPIISREPPANLVRIVGMQKTSGLQWQRLRLSTQVLPWKLIVVAVVDVARSFTTSYARICVSSFILVANPCFSFHPGNWVDFFIEGVPTIGGYSMCSTPSELPKLRLAVKRSMHPPAAWCHSKAAIPGVKVRLKSGGQYQWNAAIDGPLAAHLILIAGGIGINPLYSIVQAVLQAPREQVHCLKRISFFYSAAVPSELAFRKSLEELAEQDARLKLLLHVTRDSSGSELWEGRTGRIGVQHLKDVMDSGQVGADATLAYVCGPPGMTDELVGLLKEDLALPAEHVRFEKWW
eukprot:TRINITY_DN12111_c0_g1_i2.p1 TRINITY_DN12111_c0_g1~~TRINITY_DN12111_c0_g1_i2.p1  ORF type:complete len:332 (+),score=33.74 TRINITY_DN12111_c0_g1_i2:116-997(+)